MKKKAVIVVEILLLFYAGISLFQFITNKTLDLDEIPWVHDSYNVYFNRAHKNWDFFTFSNDDANYKWTSQQYRLFDQPHLVKYIFGFFFDIFNINLSDVNEERNLLYFVSSGKGTNGAQGLNFNIQSKEIKEQLGNETVRAIQLGRTVSGVFFLLFYSLLYVFIKKIISFKVALLSVLMMFTNPIIRSYMSYANADNISHFFFLVSLILFYFVLFKSDKISPKIYFFASFLSAISTSLAMSAKINGVILIYIFIIARLIQAFYIKAKEKNVIKEIVFWLLVVVLNYIYLQPELWNNPLIGMFKFLTQRFDQQVRFYNVFGRLDVFEYCLFLLNKLVYSNDFMAYIFKIGLVSGGVINSFSLFLTSKISKTKKLVFLLFLLMIFSFFYTYGNVGFDRYAVLPILFITVISSYGFVELIVSMTRQLVIIQNRKLSRD